MSISRCMELVSWSFRRVRYARVNLSMTILCLGRCFIVMDSTILEKYDRCVDMGKVLIHILLGNRCQVNGEIMC